MKPRNLGQELTGGEVMSKRGLKYWLFTLFLLAVGTAGALVFAEALLGPAGPLALPRISRLPDFDYVGEAERLKEEGKLEEALGLVRVVQKEGLPGRERAAQLEAQIEEEQSDPFRRILNFFKGFVSGEGQSIEEVTASILSDMTLYGDVRDLTKQAYYKLANKDPDPVVATLAALGLATELFDVIDWAPAFMKAARKAGALTDSFADWLLRVSKKSLEAGKLEPALDFALSDLKTLREKQGIQRTIDLFRHVDGPDDLKAIARFTETAPDSVYLVVRNSGEEGLDLLRRLPEGPKSVEALKLAARKGPEGIKLLLRPVPKLSRVIKSLYLGRVSDAVMALVQKNPAWMLAPLGVSAACFGWAVLRLKKSR